MTPRNKPQRIAETRVSPTITQTNTFVQASEGIDASGAASYDFSDAILNAAPQIAKAVSAYSERDNQQLAEAGYAIASRVNKGEKLEKVVAEYLGSEATPNRLRSQLAKWVENGKITKSANPFFRRAYEEVTNKHRADHAEIEMATKIDELVGAMKAASSEGQEDMIRAGESILAGYIGDSPELYEDLSKYGAAQLREMLTARGNKLVGVALARAEDEMTQEKVQGEFNAVVKGFNHTLDIEARKAEEFGEDLDIDPEELFGSTPLHIAFGRQLDNLKDIGDPKLQRNAIKNTAMSMIDSVYLNVELSVDDRTELVNYIMDETGSARSNDGTGPYALSRAGDEMQSVVARGKQVLKQLKYSKDNEDSDRTSGIEWAMSNLYDESWMRKSPEDWTDAERERRQEVLQMVSKDYGGSFLQGVMYVEGREREILSAAPGSSKATPDEMGEMAGLEKDRYYLYDAENVPLFGSQDAKSAWATGGGASSELTQMRFDALARHESVVKGEIDKQAGSVVSIVRHALKPEYGLAYADLGEDALTSAVATEEENKVLNDGYFEQKMLQIDNAMRNGSLKPQEAVEARRAAAVSSYRSLADNPTSYHKIAKDERARIDETRQKMADPEAAGTWVGSGAKYTVNVPKSPLDELSWSDRNLSTFRFDEVLRSGKLFDDDAEFPDLSDEQIESLRKGTVNFLDGHTKKYFATRVNINVPNFDTLGSDYFEYLESVSGTKFRREPHTGLLKRIGPGALGENITKYMAKYSGSLDTVYVDENGDYRLNPEAIPSLSVLGVPDEIRTPEIMILYPGAAKVGEGSAVAAHGISTARLNNKDEYVTGIGDSQKMRIDMTNIVGVDPLIRRAWATSQSLFEFSQGQEYDERNVSHRRTMSYIWLHVSSNESRRKVKR